MKKIDYYRRLLGVEKKADLRELKSSYRNLMKEYHPDKLQEDPEQNTEDGKRHAEEKSKKIIEAYHFLVSIAPETIAESLDQYKDTINHAGIDDFHYKDEILKIDFSDGNSYEYHGVPKNTYVNMVNAPAQARYARRHICFTYTYRSLSKLVASN